ncbi:MAG TPA: alpha/beta fold hydrolase [Solirubrobacteraceae bacterium]|jgi:pimeloyl-ACP methyl ester carboxylesterase
MTLCEVRLDASAGPVRALLGGEGEIALVALHGGGGLHHDPSFELLAGEFGLLAPELPGFAETQAPPPSSFADSAAAVAEILDTAGIERCTLMGISFGAVVALHMALAQPDRFDALVLLSPATFRPPDWQPPLDIARALFASAGGERPAPSPPELAARRHVLVDRLLTELDEDALRATLPALEIATLVVCGTEDGLFGPDQGRVYRELMPNCSFVLLYDAAHELGWDRPEALAELVGDFVRRREAFVVGVGGEAA